MFYETQPSNALRFGDVVSGFALTAPHFETPIPTSHPEDYKVTITFPRHSVVLSPCCSIGASTVLLSPLKPILRGWLGNPYFLEDFARINRPMTPQQVLSPEDWERLSENEKQERLEFSKPAYALVEYFVYEQHPLLPTYPYNWKGESRQIGHYMIDFRKVHKVECPKIKSATDSPLEAKVLQLSIDTRTQLRDKIAYYFGRTPMEDQT